MDISGTCTPTPITLAITRDDHHHVAKITMVGITPHPNGTGLQPLVMDDTGLIVPLSDYTADAQADPDSTRVTIDTTGVDHAMVAALRKASRVEGWSRR
jgi:hypothetical protein